MSAPTQTEPNDVRTLDILVQVHTLMALMESRVSTKYQQYLFQAYQYVVKIWQVCDSACTFRPKIWKQLILQLKLIFIH